MNKFFTIFLLLLSSFVCIGQQESYKRSIQLSENNIYVPDPFSINKINITSNQYPEANGWAKHGSECAGCPSYYYMVQRSSNKILGEDGIYYYYYFFYFFSNSYYTNGQPANTYMSELNFYINNNWIFNVEYLLLENGRTVWGAWTRSQYISNVQFDVNKITVY